MSDELDVDEATIELSRDFAIDLMDELEETLPEEVDHCSVVFGMFIYAIHELLQYGWTKEDLLNEVHTHEALETTEGMIQ